MSVPALNADLGNNLSWLAFSFNVMLNLSQFPLMWQMLRDGDASAAGKYKAAPALNQTITAGMWLGYAVCVLPANRALLANNVIGFSAAAIYTGCFLFSRPGARAKAVLAASYLTAVAVPVVVYASLFSGPRAARDAWASALTTLITLAFWASPLVALRGALADLDASRVPVPLTLTMLATTATWTAVGFLVGDITLVVCSVIGVALSALQLAVLAVIVARARGKPAPPAALATRAAEPQP